MILQNIAKRYWWTGIALLGLLSWSIAQALEVYGQWPACRLCHIERFIFFIMGISALLRLVVQKTSHSQGWLKFFGYGTVLASTAGAFTAGYHSAIQFHWIALPTFCQLPKADTLDQFMALPSATCDQWTMSFLFLPVPLYLLFLFLGIAYITWRFFLSEKKQNRSWC